MLNLFLILGKSEARVLKKVVLKKKRVTAIQTVRILKYVYTEEGDLAIHWDDSDCLRFQSNCFLIKFLNIYFLLKAVGNLHDSFKKLNLLEEILERRLSKCIRHTL